jgi:hypothetical protein
VIEQQLAELHQRWQSGEIKFSEMVEERMQLLKQLEPHLKLGRR